MTDRLRAAAEAALEALEKATRFMSDKEYRQLNETIEQLRAALAEPVEFDHGIGADRFKVVRGAFWWHVLIGDSPTKHGKFGSRADAEKMAATLLREFRNGAFVQHEAALAEPEAEPRREWTGLTDEEVSEIIDRVIGFNNCWGLEKKFARAIEAALKGKNHDSR